jgi:phenylpropionate dioxygenase-like ring-hydroxylating dioxygenase large terminal subunit
MTSPTNEAGAASAADPIRAYLDRGIKNYWYPVAPSWQVGDAPIGITRLGEQIVLWRDKNGQVNALEDRCPHRGARLSLGWNLGNRVACWYHGIEVDGSGTVQSVPAVSACPLEGQTCVKSYPAQEHAGAIFLWFGDEAHKEPAPLQLPEELVGEEYASFLCMSHWKCNYQYAIDNVMDPMHGAYLHATSHSMAEGDKQADMRVRKTDTGLMFE